MPSSLAQQRASESQGSVDSTGQIKDIVLFTSHPPFSSASRRSQKGSSGVGGHGAGAGSSTCAAHANISVLHGITAQAAAGSEELMHVLIYIRFYISRVLDI